MTRIRKLLCLSLAASLASVCAAQLLQAAQKQQRRVVVLQQLSCAGAVVRPCAAATASGLLVKNEPIALAI